MTGKPSLPRLLSSRRRQPSREGRTRGKQAPERNLRRRKFRYTLPGPQPPDRRTRRTKARNQPPAPGKNHPYVRCAGNNPQATLPRRSLTVSRTAGETDIVSTVLSPVVRARTEGLERFPHALRSHHRDYPVFLGRGLFHTSADYTLIPGKNWYDNAREIQACPVYQLFFMLHRNREGFVFTLYDSGHFFLISAEEEISCG